VWRAVGYEPTETLAMLGDEDVQDVDEPGQMEGFQRAADRSREPKRRKEHDAAPLVARDRCPIAEDHPPAFLAAFLRHRGEETLGLLIRKRQQCHFPATVERGDDPRRPATESSAVVIQQNRTAQRRGDV
jgi:hypothetical protein